MTTLKNANQALQNRQYAVAIDLYSKVLRNHPELRGVVGSNLVIMQRRLGGVSQASNQVSLKQLEKELRHNFADEALAPPQGLPSKIAMPANQTDAPKQKYGEDPDEPKPLANSLTLASDNSADDWDTRCYPTITHAGPEIGHPSKLFVVPAFMSARNTTRYRAHHLLELCEGVIEIAIIDYRDKDVSQALFDEIEEKPDSVVIIQRLALSDSETTVFLDRLRQTPVRIVYDLDDQIFDESELEPWRVAELAHSPQAYWRAMNYADQFLVSTKALRRRLERAFQRPVHILPNALNKEILSRSRHATAQHTGREGFIIGYASGSATHDRDLASALDGISRFLRAHPQAKLHCLGDADLPKVFEREHKAQIQSFPKVDWRELPERVARFSVQILPLEDVPFNQCKSQIRYLESAAVGVPVLASKCGEQAMTIIDGHTGKLCINTADDWHQGLEWFFQHPEESLQMGARAREFLTRYWTTQSPLRREKWRSILQDFQLGRMRDKISIVLVVYNPIHDVRAICESISRHTKVPYELLVWVNASAPDTRAYIQGLQRPDTYIVDLGVNVGKAFAANHLFRLALERFVVGFDDDYIAPPHWDEKLITAAKSVPNLGWLSSNLTPDSSGLRGLGRSTTYPGGTVLFQPPGVGGWVVFTTASARERIGLYREHGLYGGIDGDYNRRARAMGLITGYVRDVVGRHKIQRGKSLAWELFKQRIQDNMRRHGKQSDLVHDKFVDFSRERSQHLTCAIKISTSITHDENVWGDTHYAYGLKSALEALDYEVRIDKHECWYQVPERTDLVIHLFGLHEYDPDPESLNILWIISHVDKTHRDQLLKYDYIFCASRQVADRVAKLAPEIRSDVLYQCTDSSVFNTETTIPRDIDVLFVGNSRRIYRDSVRFAIEAGVDLKVWGTKWEQFIPKHHVQAQSVQSDEVANLYRRARIVLNDHWVDQRNYGLVNNRIYDGFACGACVLSDYNSGVADVFPEIELPMFKDAASFEAQLSALLADEPRRAAMAHTIGEQVRSKHSFEHRAAAIHQAVRYLIFNYVDYKSEKLYQIRQKAQGVKG